MDDNDDELQKEFGQSLMENVAKMKKSKSGGAGDSKKGSVYVHLMFVMKHCFMFDETSQET